jgi:hypothetical protein
MFDAQLPDADALRSAYDAAVVGAIGEYARVDRQIPAVGRPALAMLGSVAARAVSTCQQGGPPRPQQK